MSLTPGQVARIMRIFPMTSDKQKGSLSYLSFAVALMLCTTSAGASARECERSATGEAIITVHCGAAPSATFDETGRLWVAFVHDQHVFVSHSVDSGNSFSPSVQVNAVAEDTEYNGENRPKIVTRDGRTLLLSWTTKTSAKFTGEIRFTRSTDGGRSFEAPRTINDDRLFTGHRFESLYLTESGHLYLAWIDKRDLEASMLQNKSYVGAAIYYAVSDDLGATFSANHRVANNSCECCRIAIAPNGADRVTILWRQVFGEDVRDHAIAALGKDGVVEDMQRATYDEWHINACPHHGPSMVGEPGSDDYHLVWFSNGEVNQGIHYGRYSPSTQSTTQVLRIDGTPGAGHPHLASVNGKLYLVWKGFDGKQTNLQRMISDDGGKHWSAAQTLLVTAQASDHPLLVTTKDAVYLSWQTEEFGYRFEEISGDR